MKEVKAYVSLDTKKEDTAWNCGIFMTGTR